MKLLPFVRIFFAPDDAGGGGAATVDAPAASADAVLDDLKNFDAPNLDELMGAKPAKPDEVPIVEPKDEPKKEEPKKPEEPKQPEKKQSEPLAKQLRDELERTRKERDEFRSKAENHPRVKELEGSIAELTKERDTLKAEIENARKELDIRDPLASSKLREHQEKFDQEFSRSIELVPEIEGQYQQLVADFAKLPRNDREQYRAALTEFEGKVEELVGQRKFAAAMDLIRKGHDFVGENARLQKELRENGSKLAFEARQSEWSKQEKEVSDLLATAFDVPEDLEETDPYNPALFVRKALSLTDEAKQKEITGSIDRFVKQVFAGVRPRTDKDFPGLSQQEIQEKLAAEGQVHTQSRQAAVRMMKQGMLALTMLRPILSDYAKLRERVKKEGDSIPPNPNEGGDPSKADTDDLSTYIPPSISI